MKKVVRRVNKENDEETIFSEAITIQCRQCGGKVVCIEHEGACVCCGFISFECRRCGYRITYGE